MWSDAAVRTVGTMTNTSRTALVTGASRGIGQATAVALARDGHRVAACFSRDEQGAADTCAAVEAVGGEAMAVKADVADRVAVDSAFEQVEEAWGRVEVVVANADLDVLGRIGALFRF